MDNDEDKVFQAKPTNKADRVKGVIYCGDDYKKWLWNGSKYRQVCCRYGCTKQAQFCTDVCVMHGAVAIRCSVSMCESKVVRGGKCYKHGEATACVIDGCTNPVKYSKSGCCETHLTNKRKHIKTKF